MTSTTTTNTEHRHLRPRPRGEDLLPRPPAWTRAALCAKVGSPSDWSPDPSDTEAAEAAIEVCGHCPVRAQCLADALARPRLAQGTIRGGLVDVARQSLHRRRLRQTAPSVATVPVLEARRMVRALSADGYGRDVLCRESGLSRSTVVKIRDGAGGGAGIESWVLDRIRSAYKRLSSRRPARGSHTLKAQRYAAARGWAPSAAWAGVDMADPDSRPRVHDIDAA
ncbi:WhiB family transcriptional regulator [Nocardiopsis alba]|uniref:WhiB family transcriptional regulator n=1 Tax=Nocardiopsis alba TaxID=53437 RepID=UPI0033BB155C